MCQISNEITEYHAALVAAGFDDPTGMVAEAFDMERDEVEQQVETAR